MDTPAHRRILRITPASGVAWLHGSAATRALELRSRVELPAHALMQRAGESVARLALAVAPHARRVHVLCGPGNNGGDGLVAALWLRQMGRSVAVTILPGVNPAPADAAWALVQARAAGVAIGDIGAMSANVHVDLTVDALLGVGVSRAPAGELAAAIAHINASRAVASAVSGAVSRTSVLAVDLPSGLNADTGQAFGDAVRADHTLSLLTLKPGLFTGQGRDQAGQVWFDDLGIAPDGAQATARLVPEHLHRLAWPDRVHASHKGRYGDLVVIGGERGMTGAAWLAARAGLSAGAGRVYVSPLDPEAELLLPTQPELMGRRAWWLSAPEVMAQTTVVCGCGGGQAVRDVLPPLLSRSPRLVLDADALNAIAADPLLQRLLQARVDRGLATVLTPHPLEAARLLGISADAVQSDRLQHAATLAQRWRSVVVLKGSGTVVAAPDTLPSINLSGNGKLASAGTGDVLAGWIGGSWCALGPASDAARCAAEASVWLHGLAADRCAAAQGLQLPLPAAGLIDAMHAALPR